MQAMVLAAGFGTRLSPYTSLRPKPLFPLLNRPLVAHVLDQLLPLGASRITVNGHHLFRQIKRYLDDHYRRVSFQHEEEVLGTGGGLRRLVAGGADGPLLVVNGDIFHNIDLKAALRSHQNSGALATLILHRYPRFAAVRLDAKKKRIVAIHRGDLQGRDGEELFSFTGIHVIDPEILFRIPPEGFHDIVDLYQQVLAAGGTLAARVVAGHYWRDMGTPADYLALHRDLLAGDAAVAGGPFLVDHSVHLERVTLRDWACIGAGARIGAGVRIARSVVWDGAVVPAGAVIEDRIVPGGDGAGACD